MFVRYGASVLFVLLLILCFASISQSAPIPFPIVRVLRKENPYYYPTVRSLSLPPRHVPTTLVPPPQRISKPKRFYSVSTSLRRDIDRRAINPGPGQAPSSSSNSNNLFTNSSSFKFDLGNVTAINLSLNEFIKSAQEIIRELLITSQTSFLRIIGQVDQGMDRFQKDLQGHLFSLILTGQMTSAEVQHALPPILRDVIERLRTPPENEEGGKQLPYSFQIAQALQNLRKLKKMFRDAFAEHEVDFHNVFQDRFTQINQYLRVPELPKRQFGWFDR